MSDLLKGKTAVITGAGRGIGQATAILFAKEGAKLLLCDLDREPLGETVSKVKSLGANVIGLTCNVTKQDDCTNVMKTAAEKLGNGSIDILANIAGITHDKVIHKMSLEDWNFILGVNLTGTFNCVFAASPYMRDAAKKEEEKSGKTQTRSIINISSTSGTTGNAGQINYAASKAGIIGLTKTVAKEWARFNVTCNAVAPGVIETRLTQTRKPGEDFGIPEEQKQMITMLQKQTGLNRDLGQPTDVAKVVLFFASDLASYVTGQVLTVAGGMIGSI
ncbi:MAG: SDR family oxidoreductase [Candidatus Melainabacteria bacterium]|nr:SDR family oxidoreductase [Candidatus Melainabacteria bacterium]